VNHYFKSIFMGVLILTAAAFPASGAESDAIAISQIIQQRHIPNGTIIDPIFASASSQEIIGYTRGGDSAIWTGHYLAAEAFRYKVTASPEALANVLTALRGIRALRVVTGSDLLARCLVPIDWPFASSITREEADHGIYTGLVDGQSYRWVGETSRDQYAGVFFGLGVAYDMVEDPAVRALIHEEVTALLDFLLKNNWTVVMPNHSISTVFWGRADQQLSFLQVGRRVNPERFDSIYASYRSQYAALVIAPIALECLNDYSSYFKFNIDEANLYNLIRLEETAKYHKRYLKAYKLLRRTLAGHRNAYFNMIDRGLKEPDSARDDETRSLLEEWLKRPRRDVAVDNRGKYRACGNSRACDAIAVTDRVPTDFIWQRNPFDLVGGGAGTIETAGIDYILPYWMARYYGVISN
jgi:hypothetical protein